MLYLILPYLVSSLRCCLYPHSCIRGYSTVFLKLPHSLTRYTYRTLS